MSKKYDVLFKAHKEALNEIDRLKKDNELLKTHRNALVTELRKTEQHDKSINAIFEAFSNNLVKSFKAKNVINMNEDELNAMYYMLEQYIDLVDLLKLCEYEDISEII